MLALADWALTVTHVAVILGFILLWIPRSTVRVHRWLVALTAASWLGLGAFEGLGYCFLTDLQWRVKHARGARYLPHSFIKYMTDFLTGRDLPAAWLDAAAALVFVGGCIAAVWRLQEQRRRPRAGGPAERAR
jgi:hypothetical protein